MNDANEEKFLGIRPDALLLYGSKDWDIYLFVSQKYLKISHLGEDAESRLISYQKKGVVKVFMTEEQYLAFVASVREMLHAKIKAEVTPEKKGKNLSSAHDMLKTLINDNRLGEESRDLALQIAKESQAIIGDTNIFKKFKEFQKNCSQEYVHAIMTGYLASMVIDTFSWANDEIKIKVTLAALLCDILLKPEQFEEIRKMKNDPKNLSPRTFNHPKTTADALANADNFLSAESLAIIKQHHERPNGTGYPIGMTYQKITPLTCIYIVCTYFVERMFDKFYDEDDHDERSEMMVKQVQEKFYSGNFRKASNGLATVFGFDTN
jgi:HD-GYP domain-containing protein (c-di-GMP phosphodiesterase class II)